MERKEEVWGGVGGGERGGRNTISNEQPVYCLIQNKCSEVLLDVHHYKSTFPSPTNLPSHPQDVTSSPSEDTEPVSTVLYASSILSHIPFNPCPHFPSPPDAPLTPSS